ncbi:MAG: dethiobiotin synthase [Myxococcota bacterium]|nr:dethiobiotin synthase [Myxococcota bacterium]
MISVPPLLFVTGTDTEVGKTVVTAALAASLPGNVRALKPVATGVSDGSAGEDAELLGRAAGHDPLVMQTWLPALSPHRAAALAGDTISLNQVVQWISTHRGSHTLVEGVGGWRVPIHWDFGVSELAQTLDAPVLVVSANRLGTLNHTRLTVEAVRDSGLKVWGVVLNDGVGTSEDEARAHNYSDLQRFLPDYPIVRMPRIQQLTREQLAQAGAGLIQAFGTVA